MTHFKLITWLWKHLHNYFLKIMHSLSIVEFWNKKYELVTLVKNFKYMIEFMTSFPIRKDKND
jgi:hypothetical protein